MRILLINPPHPSIGSRLPGEHLPPLGLLSIGGPLIDKGHEVRLLDAEFGPMGFADIVAETLKYRPALVLLGHSGSTSAQPIISTITKLIRQQTPSIKIALVEFSQPIIGAKYLRPIPRSIVSCATRAKKQSPDSWMQWKMGARCNLYKGWQFDWMEPP
jgi:radical SAM superfamily enzyme YgiQ (UPF0313 family)